MNLPKVIDTAVALADIVLSPKAQLQQQLPADAPLRRVGKQVIFCITRDIPDDVLKVLEGYGKVLDYDHNVHNNVPIKSMDFQYMILDTREKGDRYFFIKQVKPIEDDYNVLLYCHMYELEDLANDNHYDNTVVQFPERQNSRADYELLLLSDRLQKPRWYLSLFKCLYQAYYKTK